MGLKRGIAQPLLLIVVFVVIISNNGVEANPFSAIFGRLFGNIGNSVSQMIGDVKEKIDQRFSVLSGIFGEGKTRADLQLPEIINGAFSRNNGIAVANVDENTDWKLGDGSGFIGAISTGGSVTVVKNGDGGVAITTKNEESEEQKEEEQKEEEEPKPEEPKPEEPKPEEPKPEDANPEEDGEADTPATEEEVGGENEPDGTVTTVGEDLDEAFYELMEDWDAFVTSSIWDIQDGGEPDEPLPSPEMSESLDETSRVINGLFFGNPVPAGASFAVKFFYNNEANFYCSGSLIGYPYVLTAAHCGVVVGDDVRVGGRLLRSGYKGSVEEVYLHPKFDSGSLVHDIAIVKVAGLEGKKTLIENGVKAARINKKNKFPDEGFVGVLSGHGSVETDGSGASEELRSTRHSIYPLDKCQKEITQGNLEEEDTYLCAGDGERSTTCVGDSGAGLWRYRVKKSSSGKVRKYYELFGVVSFGEVTDDALCPRGPPTVFQKTSASYDWIVEVVGKKNLA